MFYCFTCQYSLFSYSCCKWSFSYVTFSNSFMCSSLLVYFYLSNNKSWCMTTCLSLSFTSCYSFKILVFTYYNEIWTYCFFSTMCWLTNFNLDIFNDTSNMCWLYSTICWNMLVICLCGSTPPPIVLTFGVWKPTVTLIELMLEDILNDKQIIYCWSTSNKS